MQLSSIFFISLLDIYPIIKYFTSISSFYSSIYQPLSSSHCMEEKLSGIKSRIKRIFYKPFGSGMFAISLKMWQTPLSKPVRNSLSRNCLLSHTSNHLAQIDIWPFGSTEKHLQGRILRRQIFTTNVSHFVTDFR